MIIKKQEKQKQYMKQMMNQVNPKAGTLKHTNGNFIRNASRKLIAFVLMMAITLQTSVVFAAGDYNGDTCCIVEKKEKSSKFTKVIRLALPSSENLRKADSEMTSNLYYSIKESKVKKFKTQFQVADTEMNVSFRNETTLKTSSAVDADDAIHTAFHAENIVLNADVASADKDMNIIFNVENKGINLSLNNLYADEWMNTMFQAENISVPSAASFSIADAEINNLHQERNTMKIAIR